MKKGKLKRFAFERIDQGIKVKILINSPWLHCAVKTSICLYHCR